MDTTSLTHDHVKEILKGVMDPEIPVLSVFDMGVIREIKINEQGCNVTITPTYSGCPAMNTIEEDIYKHLHNAGIKSVEVNTVLSPAWTTDWMTEEGKQKLEEYGIAAPVGGTKDKRSLFLEDITVKCPQCKSENTILVSEFGSTACKAMYKCKDCLEPFDYFKCI